MTVTVTALKPCDQFPFCSFGRAIVSNWRQSALALALALSFEHQTANCISKFQFIESFEHLIEVKEQKLMEKQENKVKKQTYDNYFRDYEQRNTKRVSLNLSNEKDADIIKALDGETNIQGTIKRLIRNGLESEK